MFYNIFNAFVSLFAFILHFYKASLSILFKKIILNIFNISILFILLNANIAFKILISIIKHYTH